MEKLLTPTHDTTPTTELSAQGLTFGYEPDHRIIQDLSATLTAGQLCAMVGPNAAGKSTLLRLLIGQLQPWSGRVDLDGQDVTAMPPGRRAKWISYVPQRAWASFAFTVGEVVAMGRYALRHDPGAVEHALQCCELDTIRHSIYAHLSVGQQQRVLLARALAQATGHGRVMILDEPGSAMDLRHTHQTMRILVQLARSGVAVLAVLHDLTLAARYADTVWLMNEGQIAAAGPWHDVLTPQTLEPVYRVRIQALNTPDHDRPIFDIQPHHGSSDKLSVTRNTHHDSPKS